MVVVGAELGNVVVSVVVPVVVSSAGEDDDDDDEDEHGDNDVLDSKVGHTTSGLDDAQDGQVNGPLGLELDDSGAGTRHWHCPVCPGTSVSSTLKPSGVLVIHVSSCWGE